MPRTDLDDILAFLSVARERSFTRAAAQRGVLQSALSQTEAWRRGSASGC
jgi:DNA-binding transcriptional LysR family regulator